MITIAYTHHAKTSEVYPGQAYRMVSAGLARIAPDSLADFAAYAEERFGDGWKDRPELRSVRVGLLAGGNGASGDEAGAPTRPDDREALPPGYRLTGGRGGYYDLKAPDGRKIEGLSNGKHQGKDAAADAAWDDFG